MMSSKPPYQFTPYFEKTVLRRRPYLRREWCIRVLMDPVYKELQNDGRTRHWGPVPELGGRYLRVVTLPDGITIHNAFLDRRFKP